jgi:hypothetical protein
MLATIQFRLVCCLETKKNTLREANRLRVFDNRVLRISGPRRETMTGGCRKLCKEELRNF